MNWLAHYHYIFVHFPIALFVMTGIAELMMRVRNNASLESTVNFLLISALLFTFPTIATGLLLEDTGVVTEGNHLVLEWHESFAFITLALALVTLFLRFWYVKRTLYVISLALLIISVMLTAHFGGMMAFGPLSYLPSF